MKMEGDPTSCSAKRPEIVSSWDCGSPLYDSYELVSIFSKLDRGLAALYPYSTPPPHRHNCHASWISFHTQKLNRASCQISTGNGFDKREDGCKSKVNKKNPLRWLFRLPRIVSHRKKAIALWRTDAAEYPSEEQIVKEDGRQTRKGSGMKVGLVS